MCNPTLSDLLYCISPCPTLWILRSSFAELFTIPTYSLWLFETVPLLRLFLPLKFSCPPQVKCYLSFKTLKWTEYLCLPKICMLKPNAQHDGIRKWGLWEGIRSQGWVELVPL